jgi:N-acyl-L-homoserine lactone synthetase
LQETIMRVVALARHQLGENLPLLMQLFSLRRRVFRERLDWQVAVSGEFEIDIYDALNPIYLVLVSDRAEVVGGVRFLPTTGPTMLSETFRALLGCDGPPRSDAVIESSRFCVDTERLGALTDKGLSQATYVLFAGMIEWARATGKKAIVTVTDVRMERILRRAGWPLERFGSLQRIGTTTAVAGYLSVSDEALAAVYQKGHLTGAALREVPEPQAPCHVNRRKIWAGPP